MTNGQFPTVRPPVFGFLQDANSTTHLRLRLLKRNKNKNTRWENKAGNKDIQIDDRTVNTEIHQTYQSKYKRMLYNFSFP